MASEGLLIVYHSRTGGAGQMARAAFEGAEGEGPCRLLRACEAQPGDMLAARGYIFCAPENLAALSGEMKEFFDRCYYPLLGEIEGRAYAQMVCAGSDGQNAIRQIARIAQGWRLKPVQEPVLVCTHAQSRAAIEAPKRIGEEDMERCRELGQGMGAGLAMGAF